MGGSQEPKITAGAMLVFGLIVLAIIAGIIRTIARLLKWLEEMAMSVGDALLLILKWTVVGTSALFVLFAVIGLIELLVRAQRRRARQLQAISTCELPRGDAIRGVMKGSPVHREMADAFVRELRGVGGNSRGIQDAQIEGFRPYYARALRKPANAGRFDAVFTEPLHRKLREGCPDLEEWIESTCTPSRKPLWLVRRAWNVVTFGKLGGLNKGETTTRKTLKEIRSLLDEFRQHLWHEGWSVLPWLERQLWPQLEEHKPVSLPTATVIQGPFPSRPAPPRPRAQPQPQVRQALPQVINLRGREQRRQADDARVRKAALGLVEAIEATLGEPTPWLAPETLLLDLLDPLDEVVQDHPDLAQAKALHAELRAMLAEVPRAKTWVEQRLSEPPDGWPALVNEACTQAATSGELSDEIVMGHALRLYLTKRTDEGNQAKSGEQASGAGESTPMPSSTHVAMEEGGEESTASAIVDAGAEVTGPIPPTPGERVEVLF